MKYLQVFLFVVVMTGLISCNQQDQVDGMDESVVNFSWKGDTLGSSYYPYAAILIPMEMTGKPVDGKYFHFQTGVSNNVLYEDFASSVDLETDSELVGFSGSIGNISMENISLSLVHRNFGVEDSVVGCVGLDAFKGKCLEINFPDQWVKALPKENEDLMANAVEYEIYLEKKLLIPIVMDGNEYKFLLNPESPLYVVFNYDPSEIILGEKSFSAPESQSMEDVNPAFDGILGYAFLKDKILWIDPASQMISISLDGRK